MVSTRPQIPPRNTVTTPIKTPVRVATVTTTPRRTPFMTTRQQAAAAKVVMTPTIKTLMNNHDNNNLLNNDQSAKKTDPIGDDICIYYKLHDKKLGEGGFAKVRLATHLATNQLVAVKVLDKVKLGAELPRIYNEIECLKKLKHQNIARLYQVFETQRIIYLVLEYCPGGELFDYIVKNTKLSEMESAQIIHDLMKVLDYIHVNGFAHRDLKPENVLLDDKHHIKLIDFGLAANCSAEHLAQNRNQAPIDQLSTCCGSVTYAAPEVISGENYSGTAVDVWSAGVMLYALLVGQLPFNDNSINKLYQKIQSGLKSVPQFLSREAADLIRKMLTVDPKERITVREVLQHPWLRNRANRFARINRRLDFKLNQLDDQIIKKCSQIFPKIDQSHLQALIQQDFNYYSTTYHILQAKCPPRSFGVKRTPDAQQMAHQDYNQTPDPIHHSSPTKKSRYVTVTNTPRTPKTPTSYLHELQQVVVHQTPTNGSTTTNNNFHLSSRLVNTPVTKDCNNIGGEKYSIDNEKGAKKMETFIYKPTPKKSIVKRLLDSVTPKKRYKKIKS